MTDNGDKQTENTGREPGSEPQEPRHKRAEEAPTGEARADAEDGELARLRQERDRLDNQLKHAMADLANFRKRQAKERVEIRHAVIESLAAELLPVLDNFQYALAAEAQQSESGGGSGSIVEGLRMVQTMLTAALERHGLTEIPAEGRPFDPSVHEAVGVEARDGVQEGTILSVAQTGYQLGDRVVRPSRVTVAGAEAEPGDNHNDTDSDPR